MTKIPAKEIIIIIAVITKNPISIKLARLNP